MSKQISKSTLKRQSAIALIEDERRRQSAKGYDVAHDDAHDDGSLADLAAYVAVNGGDSNNIELADWAFDYADHILAKWDYDRIHQLTIAAALIVAEIERLQRAAVKAAEGRSL